MSGCHLVAGRPAGTTLLVVAQGSDPPDRDLEPYELADEALRAAVHNLALTCRVLIEVVDAADLVVGGHVGYDELRDAVDAAEEIIAVSLP